MPPRALRADKCQRFSTCYGYEAKAICYCTSRPLMLGLGGAQLRGQSVKTVPKSEQHLAVQFDASLHNRTIAEVEKLAGKGAPK